MITVFVAKKIITMTEAQPEATAVAVRDGIILEVGSLDSLKPWLEHDEYEIVEDYTEQVLMPGLIDPHLHPIMAAVLLPMQFITALEWKFPWEIVPATTTREAYLSKLKTGHEQTPKGEPFFTWGYHRNWHGEVNRIVMDEIFGPRPAVVWQRSFHELYLNTAMMEHLGIEEEQVKGRPQIDYEKGHFYENGLSFAIGRLNKIIMSQAWLGKGLGRLKKVVHYGGQTTVGDMAVGLFDFNLEWEAVENIIDQPDSPFRVLGVPHARVMSHINGGHKQGVEFAQTLPERNTNKFRFSNKIKLFTDGAFFSQLAMLKEPGYVDGHIGEWLTVPEEYEVIARLYWQAGFEIHVHCTGDLGLELAIDTLEKLQSEQPRFNHNYTIEHFGFSTPEQIHRIKRLGANVSANVYYLHELSDSYGHHGVGFERASEMARIGQCEREDVLLSLHSDFPMAPALPLNSAWVAFTRENCEGNIVCPNERVSLDKALRAITIDAARILGLDDETGSIRAGKKADFVVLDQSPYDVGGAGLKDLEIMATVFEGEVFPISGT